MTKNISRSGKMLLLLLITNMAFFLSNPGITAQRVNSGVFYDIFGRSSPPKRFLGGKSWGPRGYAFAVNRNRPVEYINAWESEPNESLELQKKENLDSWNPQCKKDCEVSTKMKKFLPRAFNLRRQHENYNIEDYFRPDNKKQDTTIYERMVRGLV